MGEDRIVKFCELLVLWWW